MFSQANRVSVTSVIFTRLLPAREPGYRRWPEAYTDFRARILLDSAREAEPASRAPTSRAVAAERRRRPSLPRSRRPQRQDGHRDPWAAGARARPRGPRRPDEAYLRRGRHAQGRGGRDPGRSPRAPRRAPAVPGLRREARRGLDFREP